MSTALDRLVSEKVMGWTHSQDNPWGYPPSSGPWWKVVPQRKWSLYETLHVSNVPDFSGDIAAAWEVVEHLRKQRSATDKLDDPTWAVALNGSGDRWICDVSDWRGRLDVSACNKEACVAICLAALRAVGVPESEIQEAMR